MPRGDESAYPFQFNCDYDRRNDVMENGITIREHFAGLAMQGLLSNLASIRREGFKDEEIELFAVMRADALIAELNKEIPSGKES